eukprot:TRINITY_DN5146_c0_g1_i10.p2 TRINITY_DN5146_c0_g1~~TRINITY_DN5146_c0_g1_i10.p2  ORF type:complete len:180 (+),score=37.54 TRINITY_DN5146_c0_g1_i10:374-913(+)
MTKLKNLGIKEEEVQTNGLAIYPQYQSIYQEKNQSYTDVFIGFKVNNNILIRTAEMSKAGEIIDLAVEKGVTKISDVYYDISEVNKTKIRKSLIKSAIADAKENAQLLVEAVGYKLKSIKSVELENNTPVYDRYDNKMAMSIDSLSTSSASSSPTQVYQSTQTISVSVSLEFIIEKEYL